MNAYVKRIKELKEVIKQMENEKCQEELLSFPWVGNLGQWYWLINNNQVIFNEKKVTNLGYNKNEIPEEVGFEFFTEKLHPDDYENVMDNMRRHLMNKSDAYEVEYRIRTKDKNYVWYYDRGKVTKRDENGKAIIITGIVFDITVRKNMEIELKELNEKLLKMVTIDELTGIYNRRFMIKKIQSEIERFNRNKSRFSIIMLDIDRFKLVNDNFGHNEGDIVLKKIASLIENRIRKTDFLCRWGGEEFIILLPETETSNAVILAENIREEISKTAIGKVGSVTVSLGVSSYIIGDTVDTVVKRADELMYFAKAEGRNCVRF